MNCRTMGEPMPVAIEVEGDPFEASMTLSGLVKQQLGARVFLEEKGSCVIVPPPHKVYLEGRTLRGEEYAGYAQAVLAAAGNLPVCSIRHSVEHLCPLDFDAFDRALWARLNAVYAEQPGWLGASDLPRWFGTDDRTGPILWASVEPPGLQVGGIVELDRFEDWLGRFHSATADLPVRQ